MRPKQGEPAEYPTLSAFWTARPPRRTSPEDEYGRDWHAGAARGSSWRVSYIRATREGSMVIRRWYSVPSTTVTPVSATVSTPPIE